MPSFSFEKISSPPSLTNGILPAAKGIHARGVIVQLLDRLAAARLQRDAHKMGYTESDVTPQRTRGF